MPSATAALPRSSPSPPDSAVAPHGLGFAPPLAGTLSGNPRHGAEPVPDTEDDPRTPGSAEFFLRELPESPEGSTTLAPSPFTYEQHLQLRAQLYVNGDLEAGKPPAEHTMVHAFGGEAENICKIWTPRLEEVNRRCCRFGHRWLVQSKRTEEAEDQKHAWQEVWRAAVHRWESQNSLVPGYDTPPSNSFIGSCTGDKDTTVGKSTVSEQGDAGEKQTEGLDVAKNTTKHTETPEQNNGDEDQLAVSCAEQVDQVLYNGSCTGEQGSKDTTVGKSTVSEQGDAGEKQTEGLDVAKNTTKHTEMLEQKNADEDQLTVSCAEQVDQVLSNGGSNLKKNAVCGGQTFVKSHRSLPKNNPGKNITDIQESCHSRIKSGPNSPRDIQEFSSSRIGICIAEQCTAVGKTFISEQHISDGGEEASQGPDFGSDRNHLAESNINKADQVISDDVNNLDKNTVSGGKQSLLDSCFNCGKHGQLLKCRSCPIAAHVSCFGPFGSSVRFSDGQFYCPVCFCLKATEARKKSEKTLSEARKHLHAFLLVKPFAKQHCEQSTGNQQLSRKHEEPGHEKRNDASDACPERNYDPRKPARTRNPLAPRRRSFVTTARRSPLQWTGEEEAALREAVARFALKEKGKISWVQIREHGKEVFHPARLPKDLNQKWNYMKKRSKASKDSGV